MKLHIDPKMVHESSGIFGGIPGPSKQAIDIRPKHGEGVIDTKERISSFGF